MQETELNLKDLFCGILRKWRIIVIFALICGILCGAYAAVDRVIKINDEEEVERWQTEYEIAKGLYWSAIYDLDRKISENERLATKTQVEIANLDRQKAEYEAQIADVESLIDDHHALIENYKANKEKLTAEREQLEYYLSYQKEQNENSLLMAIDPYDVNVHEVYLRVDSGYKILPSHTYQDVDPTAELVQTYRLLVGKTTFYEQMISDLKLNTEVRYLTEIVSVTNYNTNSICVRVVNDSANGAKVIAEYIADELLDLHARVSEAIAEHEITEYNTIAYSTIDLEIYSKQQTYTQKVLSYEESIRNVDKSILDNEAAIREVNADIRAEEMQIVELNQSIEDLPLQKQELEEKISGYQDENYTFREERVKLLEKPEPVYGGYTAFGVFTGFVKFAIIGGVVGAVVFAMCIAVLLVMGGKILSPEQLCEALQCEFFGYWPQKRGKFFYVIDRWCGKLSGNVTIDMTSETATELVVSNVSVACSSVKKLMLCGSAEKDTITAIANAMKKQLPSVEVICGTTLSSDPMVVRGIAECDAVILVEQVDKSGIQTAMQLKNRAKSMDKPVLGVVLY